MRMTLPMQVCRVWEYTYEIILYTMQEFLTPYTLISREMDWARYAHDSAYAAGV